MAAAADDSLKPTDPNRLEWVASSNLKSATRDPATSILEVLFKNGKSYRYEKVTADEMAEWAAAKSAGTWFHKNIREKPEAHPVLKDGAEPIAPIAPTPEELAAMQKAADGHAELVEKVDESNAKLTETTVEYAGAAKESTAALLEERERAARATPAEQLGAKPPTPPTPPTKPKAPATPPGSKQGTPSTVHPYADPAALAPKVEQATEALKALDEKRWWKRRPWRTPNGTTPELPEPPQLGANAKK